MTKMEVPKKMKKFLIILLFITAFCFLSSCQEEVSYDYFTFVLDYSEYIENFELINFDAQYCDLEDLKNIIVMDNMKHQKINGQYSPKRLRRLRENDLKSQGKIFLFDNEMDLHSLIINLKAEDYRFPTLLEFISFSNKFDFDFNEIYAPIMEYNCTNVEFKNSGEPIFTYNNYFLIGVKHFKINRNESNYKYIYVIGIQSFTDYSFSPNKPILGIKKNNH